MSKQTYGELLHQALFNGNGIARRLIVSLILFSTLITAITTTIQLYHDYEGDVKNIHENFDFIQQSTLPVLSESVWVNDTAQIKSQIEGLLNLRDMEYVAIYIDGKIRWSAGQQTASRTVTKQIPMARDYRGKHITLGTLVTIASLDNVWQRLWQRLLVVVIDNGIKTFLVALFMMLLFQILVTRHLVKLSHYARRMEPQNLDDEDLQLDRPVTGYWRPDALDYLTQAVNDMRHKLSDAYHDMWNKTQRLHESEERLRLAMEITNEGIWDWSVREEKIFYSSGWCRMLGYEVDELAPNYTTWESRLHPEDREATLAKIQAHLDGNTERFTAEHRLRTRNNEWLWVLAQGGVIERDTGGAPLRVIGTLKNISAQKQTEQQLQQLNEELEQRVVERTEELTLARDEAQRASLAKSSFLSRMSHELRTPMNAILGFAQLLEIEKSPSLSAQQKDYVTEILHAGNHLLDLINEILDLARIESGRININSEAVAINPLVNECVTLLTPLARQQAIELQVEMEPECVVLADRLRLSQVILNLLSNAIKFNQTDGTVLISVIHQDEQKIHIAITDSGTGINKDDLSHLFRPFERLEQTSETTEGTGIGLALSKHLVEAMQGHIGVDSQPGQGSTFWVVLPAADNKNVATISRTQGLTRISTDSIGKTQQRLLYIEDNLANLKLMQKIIAPIPNLELLEATTAEHGLQIASEQQPDLIFLDIALPGMDGYAALRQLQADPRTQHIPVIAVSANVMRQNIEKGLQTGFVAYITKPFDIVKIRQTLEQYLPSKN